MKPFARKMVIGLVMALFSAAAVHAQPPQTRTYSEKDDPWYTQKLPSCRQEVGLETAWRYVHWCKEEAVSRHPPCNIVNRCSIILSPVVAACEDRRQRHFEEQPYCAEASRVYYPDAAQDARRQKEHDAYVATLSPQQAAPVDKRKLMKRPK